MSARGRAKISLASLVWTACAFIGFKLGASDILIPIYGAGLLALHAMAGFKRAS